MIHYIASSVKGEVEVRFLELYQVMIIKRSFLEMTQLNSSSDVKVGSEVVTSGLDEVQ